MVSRIPDEIKKRGFFFRVIALCKTCNQDISNIVYLGASKDH